MLYAVSFALIDSFNVLLIGVLFAAAVIHARRDSFGKVATLLIAGDWLGVFLLSLFTMLIFDGIGELVQRFLHSPILGILLILTGVVSAVLTYRGGDPAPMIQRLSAPLQVPGRSTFTAGLFLGLVQSVTSIPFFTGLAFLSAAELGTLTRWSGVVLYATLALSLPMIFGVLIAFIRRHPDSSVALFIERIGERKDATIALSGYAVAVVLIALGIVHLL